MVERLLLIGEGEVARCARCGDPATEGDTLELETLTPGVWVLVHFDCATPDERRAAGF